MTTRIGNSTARTLKRKIIASGNFILHGNSVKDSNQKKSNEKSEAFDTKRINCNILQLVYKHRVIINKSDMKRFEKWFWISSICCINCNDRDTFVTDTLMDTIRERTYHPESDEWIGATIMATCSAFYVLPFKAE